MTSSDEVEEKIFKKADEGLAEFKRLRSTRRYIVHYYILKWHNDVEYRLGMERVLDSIYEPLRGLHVFKVGKSYEHVRYMLFLGFLNNLATHIRIPDDELLQSD